MSGDRESTPAEDEAFTRELIVAASTHDEHPERLDALIEKWGLTGGEVNTCRQLIEHCKGLGDRW